MMQLRIDIQYTVYMYNINVDHVDFLFEMLSMVVILAVVLYCRFMKQLIVFVAIILTMTDR